METEISVALWVFVAREGLCCANGGFCRYSRFLTPGKSSTQIHYDDATGIGESLHTNDECDGQTDGHSERR